MKQLFKLSIFSFSFWLTGCAAMYGLTGADEGTRISNEWVEYHVTHPGLTITILEPYSPDLMPISTVGKKSPSPLTHVIKFGKSSNHHKLKIVGRYKKELYLDGKFYASIWSGDIVIKDGVLSIDGKLISATET